HRISRVVNIDEHRPSSTIGDRFGGGHESIGHGNDLITGTDSCPQENEPKRFCAAADSNRMFATTISSEFPFEFFNKGTTGKCSAVNHLANRQIDLGTKWPMLSCQINKGYSVSERRLVHG